MNEYIITAIDELLNGGIGDRGRLEHIKNSLLNDKTLYDSDNAYLNSLLNKHSSKPVIMKKIEIRF